MKKFWIINIGKNPSESDIREILNNLNFKNIDYIFSCFFFDYDYDAIKYLKKSDKIIFSNDDYNEFGWGKLIQ